MYVCMYVQHRPPPPHTQIILKYTHTHRGAYDAHPIILNTHTHTGADDAHPAADPLLLPPLALQRAHGNY